MSFKKIFSDTSKTKTEKNIVDILFELKTTTITLSFHLSQISKPRSISSSHHHPMIHQTFQRSPLPPPLPLQRKKKKIISIPRSNDFHPSDSPLTVRGRKIYIVASVVDRQQQQQQRLSSNGNVFERMLATLRIFEQEERGFEGDEQRDSPLPLPRSCIPLHMALSYSRAITIDNRPIGTRPRGYIRAYISNPIDSQAA